MSTGLAAALTVGGVLVLAAGLWDMFRPLLHPTGQGVLSRMVMAGLWRFSRATGHRLLVVGPSGMLAVLLLWVLMQAMGWALIYLPHVPEGLVYSSGIDPADYSDAVESLYLSAVTLTTLGYGDVVPTDPWIRAVSPVEALTGFALLTAGLTWFTQIYRPLSRRRSLALELKALADTCFADQLGEIQPEIVTRVLDTLTTEVGRVRIDFAQHSEGFYFQEKDPALSLPHQVTYLLRLRDSAVHAPGSAVRSSGRRLSVAVCQLSTVLDDTFLHVGAPPEEVLTAYATQHGHHRSPA